MPSKLTVWQDEFKRICHKDDAGATENELEQFSMGSLAGWEIALDDLRAQGWTGFKMHQKVWIKCVEIQPALDSSRSPMPMFEVTIEP